MKKVDMHPSLISYRHPFEEVSISVDRWLFSAPISGQYVEYPRSAWVLLNYLMRVGIWALLIKLKSRLSEFRRNQKVFGLGLGYVLVAPTDSPFCAGDPVLFFAPNHNDEFDVIVVDLSFVYPINFGHDPKFPYITSLPPGLAPAVAWTRFSGARLDSLAIQLILRDLALQCVLPSSGFADGRVCYVDYQNKPRLLGKKPTAVLFGLGNYAKTAILPNIKNSLDLQRIHEIDPSQLLFARGMNGVSLDSSPNPRFDFRFDAWLIAGFHHTHSDLAIKAFSQGAAAVIEKPLATTRAQFNLFTSALQLSPGSRFFVCFHKRYSVLNEFLRRDLCLCLGMPVDMHCIVYEIPLPQYHWYNWPSSGSRLISNGCHWLDFFLFVNGYSAVAEFRKWEARGTDVIIQVSLENGAYFTMSLTDTGSQRLGVREHIELRAGASTVTIEDASYYKAENRSRVFRTARVNPLQAYARMYKSISRSIATRGDGDSRQSLLSTDLTLLLEDL